jgi:hypothetical protein
MASAAFLLQHVGVGCGEVAFMVLANGPTDGNPWAFGTRRIWSLPRSSLLIESGMGTKFVAGKPLLMGG